MYNYTFKNIDTNHIFFQSNNLHNVLKFYHNVPRRKNTTLVIIDNNTGELLKIKIAKTSL